MGLYRSLFVHTESNASLSVLIDVYVSLLVLTGP